MTELSFERLRSVCDRIWGPRRASAPARLSTTATVRVEPATLVVPDPRRRGRLVLHVQNPGDEPVRLTRVRCRQPFIRCDPGHHGPADPLITGLRSVHGPVPLVLHYNPRATTPPDHATLVLTFRGAGKCYRRVVSVRVLPPGPDQAWLRADRASIHFGRVPCLGDLELTQSDPSEGSVHVWQYSMAHPQRLDADAVDGGVRSPVAVRDGTLFHRFEHGTRWTVDPHHVDGVALCLRLGLAAFRRVRRFTRSWVVTNDGPEPLTCRAHTGARWLTVEPREFDLAPGARQRLRVRVRPRAAHPGHHATDVCVMADQGASLRVAVFADIHVEATSLILDRQARADGIDWGTVFRGRTASAQLHVLQVGQGVLHVSVRSPSGVVRPCDQTMTNKRPWRYRQHVLTLDMDPDTVASVGTCRFDVTVSSDSHVSTRRAVTLPGRAFVVDLLPTPAVLDFAQLTAGECPCLDLRVARTDGAAVTLDAPNAVPCQHATFRCRHRGSGDFEVVVDTRSAVSDEVLAAELVVTDRETGLACTVALKADVRVPVADCALFYVDRQETCRESPRVLRPVDLNRLCLLCRNRGAGTLRVTALQYRSARDTALTTMAPATKLPLVVPPDQTRWLFFRFKVGWVRWLHGHHRLAGNLILRTNQPDRKALVLPVDLQLRGWL